MKKTNRWIWAIAAAIMLAMQWLNQEPSAYSDLSTDQWLPVLVITAVIFLIKTGALSAILIGLRKLWERFKGK